MARAELAELAWSRLLQALRKTLRGRRCIIRVDEIGDPRTDQRGSRITKHAFNRRADVANGSVLLEDGRDVHGVFDQDLELAALREVERLRR